MTLPKRGIGPFEVSAIGLGCMNLSHAYDGLPSPEKGARLLNGALDRGITLLDTAALYGGDNERLVGSAVLHRRGEFALSSKCVLDMHGGKRCLDGSPAAIAATLHRPRQRLGTDHMYLYYLDRLDHEDVGAAAVRLDPKKVSRINGIFAGVCGPARAVLGGRASPDRHGNPSWRRTRGRRAVMAAALRGEEAGAEGGALVCRPTLVAIEDTRQSPIALARAGRYLPTPCQKERRNGDRDNDDRTAAADVRAP